MNDDDKKVTLEISAADFEILKRVARKHGQACVSELLEQNARETARIYRNHWRSEPPDAARAATN